jgi:hypothetical protein
MGFLNGVSRGFFAQQTPDILLKFLHFFKDRVSWEYECAGAKDSCCSSYWKTGVYLKKTTLLGECEYLYSYSTVSSYLSCSHGEGK